MQTDGDEELARWRKRLRDGQRVMVISMGGTGVPYPSRIISTDGAAMNPALKHCVLVEIEPDGSGRRPTRNWMAREDVFPLEEVTTDEG